MALLQPTHEVDPEVSLKVMMTIPCLLLERMSSKQGKARSRIYLDPLR